MAVPAQQIPFPPPLVTVRDMRPEEVDVLAALVLASFEAFVARDFDDFGHAAFEKFASADALRTRQRHGYPTLVAEIHGKARGIVQVRPPSHVVALYVSPHYQRRGIGRQLMRAAIERIRAAYPGAAFVTVASSENALPFYRHLGFEPVYRGEREDRRYLGLRLPLHHAADPDH
ncbi:MAG TPA: GNAT family N-acetyltransferase [Pelomicrobium sp.]|nr:GNAT family N-acetyltransferase [Pelomicrobium sp.]